MRGRPAAEERPVAAGKDGGHVAGVDAGGAVADAVDATVYPKERPLLQATGDLLAADTGIQELRPGDHAVLAPRDRSYFLFDCPDL